MKYFYDRKSDSLYLTLADRHTYHDSVEAAPGVVLDFDDGGHLIGIDLERASRIIDASDLHLHEEPAAADADAARLDGETLKRTREQLGMSQAELARKLSVSPNTVARWERGELKIEHPGMLQLALASLTATQGTSVPSVSDQPTRGGKAEQTAAQDNAWASVRTANLTRRETSGRRREATNNRGAKHVAHDTNGTIRDSDSHSDTPHSRNRAKKK